MNPIRTGEQGFTLVELMMAVVILGTVIALSFSGFTRFQRVAEQSRADSLWRDLKTAALSYKFDKGQFPTSVGPLLSKQDFGPYLDPAHWSTDNVLPFEDFDENEERNVLVVRLVTEGDVVCVWSWKDTVFVASRHNEPTCDE